MQSPPPSAEAVEPNLERLQLLEKAQIAFNAGPTRGQDERAQRLLQRLWRLTTDESLQGAASAAALARGVVAVPVIVPPTSAHGDEQGTDGWSLPLLAPDLQAASVVPSLPTAHQPPLFITFNNIGLLHLRAGKLALATVFFTRALEDVQQLLASLALQPSSVPSSFSLSPPSQSGLFKQHSAPDARLLSPSAGSVAPSRSPPLAHSPSASTIRSQQSPMSPLALQQSQAASSPPLSTANGCRLDAFLLVKSLDVFYNVGITLLLRYSISVLSEAGRCGVTWTDSPVYSALQLAARCFQHCLQLPSNSIWSTVPGVYIAAASQKLLHSPVRLAECLLLLHRASIEAQLHSTPLPVLLSSFQLSVIHSNDSLDNFSLSNAVSLLRSLLTQLATPDSGTDASDSPTETLAQTAKLLLCDVLLTLRDGSSALPLLAELRDPISSSGQSARECLQVELMYVEALLISGKQTPQQYEEALAMLQASKHPIIRAAMLSCGMSTEELSIASSVDSTLRDHVISTLVHTLLLLQRQEDAAHCLRVGLDLSPSNLQLQRLSLLIHLQSGSHVAALWSIKQLRSPYFS